MKKSSCCRLQWTATLLPAATWKIWICACVFFGSLHLISSPNHFCSPVKALFEAEKRRCFLVITFSCPFLSQPLGAVLHRVLCVSISCRGGRRVLAVRQPCRASCGSYLLTQCTQKRRPLHGLLHVFLISQQTDNGKLSEGEVPGLRLLRRGLFWFGCLPFTLPSCPFCPAHCLWKSTRLGRQMESEGAGKGMKRVCVDWSKWEFRQN